MTVRRSLWPLSLAAAIGALPADGLAAEPNALIQLLDTKRCQGCKLQDSDLVRADLRDADLRKAQLQRANLSGARLEGANLQGADLSYTSLQGASLRGANLQGAVLAGTDLRNTDLSGAQLDENSLAQSHWQGATGIDASKQSYPDLHNAGVTAASQGRYAEAETFFGEAIRKIPEAAISWTARGISRAEQGKTQLAAQDFTYAAALYQQSGDEAKAKQLKDAAKTVTTNPDGSKGGNGFGTQLAQGAMSAFQALAPIALKLLGGL